MSEVIKTVEDRELAHIVKTNDNKFYYVDSAYTFDCGYETMAFTANESGEVTCWNDLYCEHYGTHKAMETRHNHIITHLEEVLTNE